MAQKDSTNLNKNKAPVMDVSHPGTSAPSHTSRPIITGSGTMLRDPMFRDSESQKADDTETAEAEEAKVPSASDKVILPLSQKEGDGDVNDGDSKPKQASEDVERQKEEEAIEESADSTASDGSAIINAVIDTSVGNKNTTRQVVKDDEERLQELINSKKYFVKTSSSSRSLLFPVVVIGSIIVAIIVFFYYAELQGWISFSLG